MVTGSPGHSTRMTDKVFSKIVKLISSCPQTIALHQMGAIHSPAVMIVYEYVESQTGKIKTKNKKQIIIEACTTFTT